MGAEGNGIKIIIAGAGGAAHLPGVVAAMTQLPVIGVPLKTSALGGVDSTWSILQMPGGVPVVSSGIGNSKNAALTAVRILALSDPALSKAYTDYRQEMKDVVHAKQDKLNKLGWREFLADKAKTTGAKMSTTVM